MNKTIPPHFLVTSEIQLSPYRWLDALNILHLLSLICLAQAPVETFSQLWVREALGIPTVSFTLSNVTGSFFLNTSLCNTQSHLLAVSYNMCHSFLTNIQLDSYPSFAITFFNQKVICRDGKDTFYPSPCQCSFIP